MQGINPLIVIQVMLYSNPADSSPGKPQVHPVSNFGAASLEPMRYELPLTSVTTKPRLRCIGMRVVDSNFNDVVSLLPLLEYSVLLEHFASVKSIQVIFVKTGVSILQMPRRATCGMSLSQSIQPTALMPGRVTVHGGLIEAIEASE